jgi:hypothetical protein
MSHGAQHVIGARIPQRKNLPVVRTEEVVRTPTRACARKACPWAPAQPLRHGHSQAREGEPVDPDLSGAVRSQVQTGGRRRTRLEPPAAQSSRRSLPVPMKANGWIPGPLGRRAEPGSRKLVGGRVREPARRGNAVRLLGVAGECFCLVRPVAVVCWRSERPASSAACLLVNFLPFPSGGCRQLARPAHLFPLTTPRTAESHTK